MSRNHYYEFRHNIMNLGNQNSKYSWRIRDLENPQTGTRFRKNWLRQDFETRAFGLY